MTLEELFIIWFSLIGSIFCLIMFVIQIRLDNKLKKWKTKYEESDYQCYDCGHLFKQEEEYELYYQEECYYGDTGKMYIPGCPKCHSERIMEV